MKNSGFFREVDFIEVVVGVPNFNPLRTEYESMYYEILTYDTVRKRTYCTARYSDIQRGLRYLGSPDKHQT